MKSTWQIPNRLQQPQRTHYQYNLASPVEP